MANSGIPGDAPSEITTKSAFQAALAGMVTEATANGVDVRGGFVVWRDETQTDGWELEIVNLATRD